jgi:hypothetical protein
MAITLDGTTGSTQPSVAMTGSSSGTITITPPAVAGTQGYTLPSALPTANGQALTATTAGVMSWATPSASPGGANTQIQFNNSSAFGGSANLTWDGTYFRAGTIQTGTNVISSANASDGAFFVKHTSSGVCYGLFINYPNSAPNNTSSRFFECSDSATTRVTFSSNGGLNNFSANNTNLSDAREKKNIALAGNYLDKINAIPVKTFLYNDQTDNDLNLGVIAQDVQAVAPELVTESDWGSVENPKMRLSVYQTDLQYALMKAIQELTARVAALESK